LRGAIVLVAKDINSHQKKDSMIEPQELHSSPTRTWAAGWRRGVILAVALGATGTIGIASAQTRNKDFTPEHVTAIVNTLRQSDSRTYLLRLPVFRDGRIVGSKLYGTLPMRQVEQLAESLKVPLVPNANVISVFDPFDEGDESGGGGGGSSCSEGGGPGSHINSQSAAWDLAKRLDVLLADIEVSRFQFLR
jgi:hypothetical protein